MTINLNSGLVAHVYRTNALADQSNHGISSRYDEISIVGVISSEVGQVLPLPYGGTFAPDAHTGAPCAFRVRPSWKSSALDVFLEPVMWSKEKQRFTAEGHSFAFGGNYAGGVGFRFGENLRILFNSKRPLSEVIRIHDRRA